jgi:predicted secreted Zn-dependent protease
MADYLARPKYGDPLAASTSSDIKANAACRDYVFTGTVTATFDPNISWFRDPQKATPALLRHEQLHFDLTEVYARIMRQKLAVYATKVDCTKLQPSFNNLTKLVYDAWDKEQNRYDQETNHGLNVARQALWEKQIQARLVQMQAFAQ